MSFGDQNGRLFWLGGSLHRGIARARAPLYHKLIEEGAVSRLVERKLLVETVPTNLSMEGFDLVLRHRTIPFVSYAYEWCVGMLRAAALLTLDLEIELSTLGLTLQDAHPWNVLFDGTQPYWVDFGSIVPARNCCLWRAYEEFCNFYLHPLLVMAQGHHRVARRLLCDSDDGVTAAEAVALTGHSRARSALETVGQLAMTVGRVVVPRRLRRIIRRHHVNRDLSGARPQFLKSLREQVAAIQIHAPVHKPFEAAESLADGAMEASRRTAVEGVVSEYRPASILEVSYGSPFYSTAAAQKGTAVVAMSVDEMHVQRLYEAAHAERLPILPLVMDFRCPSPEYGLCGQTAAAASARLVCDVAVAMDCTHILGVRYRLNFDQMAKGLAMFCRQGALLNFVAGDHPATRAYLENGDFSWYTPANLKAALGRHFRMVEEISGSSGPIYWCRK